jgi:hypothetical protein
MNSVAIFIMGAYFFWKEGMKLCVSSELGFVEIVGIGEILAATRGKLRRVCNELAHNPPAP